MKNRLSVPQDSEVKGKSIKRLREILEDYAPSIIIPYRSERIYPDMLVYSKNLGKEKELFPEGDYLFYQIEDPYKTNYTFYNEGKISLIGNSWKMSLLENRPTVISLHFKAPIKRGEKDYIFDLIIPHQMLVPNPWNIRKAI